MEAIERTPGGEYLDGMSDEDVLAVINRSLPDAERIASLDALTKADVMRIARCLKRRSLAEE